MNAALVVGVVSAVVSLAAAVVAGLMTSWSAKRTRQYESHIEAQQRALSKAEQAEAVLSRYREPLLGAALTLQSRLYYIVDQGFLGTYLHCGDPDRERNARDYTIYVLAEYLCWLEIVRRDLRFLDLGSEERNRDFVRQLEITQQVISSDTVPGPLRLFRGEQRAIGELLMIPTGDPAPARYESMGYVQFSARLDDDPAFAKWFYRLREDIDRIATVDRSEQSRLIVLQNSLVGLVEFLDPQQLRRPTMHRGRLESGHG